MLSGPLSHWAPNPGDVPPLRELTIPALLDETVAARGEATAVVYRSSASMPRALKWTYDELHDRVMQAAGALIASGVEPGDRVILWATNIPEHLVLQFACAYTGAVLVPINPLYRRNELGHVLRTVRPQAAFVIDSERGNPLWPVFYDAARDLDAIPLLVSLGTSADGVVPTFGDWLATVKRDPDAVRERYAGVAPDALAQIQFTSGTTGSPKGVELTHRSFTNQGIQMSTRSQMTTDSRVVDPMPQFHNSGCVLGNMSSVAAGAAHIPIVTFDPDAIVDAVLEEQATHILAVPTMLIAIDEAAARRNSDLSCLRVVISGASLVPPALARDWQERLGVSFAITYGQTEHGPLITVTSPDDPPEIQRSTVGRPLPHCELEIVDPTTRERVPVGAEGELRYRGFVMRGYHRDPEATARAVDENGWLSSGDLGTMDEDGNVRVTGRAKDMIIRGGENIAPALAEDAVRSLDAVSDVCVIGVPDERYGEELCAFARLHPGADLTAAGMRTQLSSQVARYAIPRYLVLVEAFPMTPSGKIQRFRLRELWDEGSVIVDDSRHPSLAPADGEPVG